MCVCVCVCVWTETKAYQLLKRLAMQEDPPSSEEVVEVEGEEDEPSGKECDPQLQRTGTFCFHDNIAWVLYQNKLTIINHIQIWSKF